MLERKRGREGRRRKILRRDIRKVIKEREKRRLGKSIRKEFQRGEIGLDISDKWGKEDESAQRGDPPRKGLK